LRLEKWFIGAAIGWAAALPVATLVAAQVRTWPALSIAGLAVYAAGSIVCHQLPDRSFHIWSMQMPVCARCTGLYAGAAIAAVGLLSRVRRVGGDVSRGGKAVRGTLLAAALPTAASLVVEWSTGVTPPNAVRALAGLPLGAAIAWVIGAALGESAHGAPARSGAGRRGPPRATSRGSGRSPV